jgi:pimeloyl-ACP methyl ester carboxylesterase
MNKRTRATLLPLVVILGATLSGCVLRDFAALSRNLSDMQSLGAVFGQVDVAPALAAQDAVVVVLSCDGVECRAINHSVSSEGRYVMRVPPGGPYRVVAFVDQNEDQRLGPDEARALSRDFRLQGKGSGAEINLTIPAATGIAVPDVERAVGDLAGVDSRPLPISMGEQARLDEPMFDRAAGRQGLWAPSDFLSNVGGGIYMLQPYAADRLPVLFVHGAAGTPAEFTDLAEAVRETGYQPWVFFYPSGLRLERSAQMLADILRQMVEQHGFHRVAIVAHSMGGLVAREAVVQLQRAGPAVDVPTLVTLAAPWGGHESAAAGVRRAPAVVPSWIDMQVGSDFQRRLLATPLPRGTEHVLLFAFRGNGNDGVVSLVSQLEPRAQAAAAGMRGYNETHASILTSPEVAREVVGVLDRSRRRR